MQIELLLLLKTIITDWIMLLNTDKKITDKHIEKYKKYIINIKFLDWENSKKIKNILMSMESYLLQNKATIEKLSPLYKELFEIIKEEL